MLDKIKQKALVLKEPNVKTSYKEEDCVFVLQDLTGKIKEVDILEKERMLRSGVHYSEMLTKENVDSIECRNFFLEALENSKDEISTYIVCLAEKILKHKKGAKDLVLVSLARAGSPIGVLLKRYYKINYDYDIPHYSISIVRGKGIDENALCYIMNKHNTEKLQFIDGWTGKGAITNELEEACKLFNKKYDTNLDSNLAVVSDPSHCSRLYGTREDILLPSACLNSIVSGLVSRTIHTDKLCGENDFHGAKYYEDYLEYDLSIVFIDEMMDALKKTVVFLGDFDINKEKINNIGMEETLKIKEMFNIDSIHKIKPSLGETTRVLLRRVPKLILVKNIKDVRFQHIYFLAKERNVEVREMPELNYNCIGLIDVVE